MSYTYTTLIAALVAETNIEATNAGFVAILPTIIDQAEGMIYREPGLYFLSTMQRDDTGFTTADNRAFTLPTFFTILQSVNAVVGNNRFPLIKLSRETLDFIYPLRISSSPTDVPTHWAPFTDQIIYLGPTPGGTTQIEVTGTVRPAPLSSTNTSTWLSTNLADFFFAACMTFMAGYMRNFGSQADDPKLALSWKGVYDALLPGATSDETRRKFEAMQ